MPKGIPNKKVEEAPIEELADAVEAEATKVEEKSKKIISEANPITLYAHGNVNNIPDGYARTFTDKDEAEAWRAKYNATE